jgi:hypothetical protein
LQTQVKPERSIHYTVLGLFQEEEQEQEETGRDVPVRPEQITALLASRQEAKACLGTTSESSFYHVPPAHGLLGFCTNAWSAHTKTFCGTGETSSCSLENGVFIWRDPNGHVSRGSVQVQIKDRMQKFQNPATHTKNSG